MLISLMVQCIKPGITVGTLITILKDPGAGPVSGNLTKMTTVPSQTAAEVSPNAVIPDGPAA